MKPLPATNGQTYTGACHCKAVSFSITGPLYPIVACHCTDCLRTAGFTWAATKFVTTQLTILTGREVIDWYATSDIAKRGFCSTCHAQIFYRENDSQVTSVSPGMLDRLDGLETAGHIFRSSMPNCCQNIENLPDIDRKFYDEKPMG